MDDHVRPQRAFVADDMQLLGEVAMLDHPGKLDDPSQRHLAPAPANFGTAQGGDEIASLTLQAVRGLRPAPSICVRRVVKASDARARSISTCCSVRAKCGLQWLDQLRDRCFAFLERNLRQRA